MYPGVKSVVYGVMQYRSLRSAGRAQRSHCDAFCTRSKLFPHESYRTCEIALGVTVVWVLDRCNRAKTPYRPIAAPADIHPELAFWWIAWMGTFAPQPASKETFIDCIIQFYACARHAIFLPVTRNLCYNNRTYTLSCTNTQVYAQFCLSQSAQLNVAFHTDAAEPR
jgi:hypothetical protein